MRLRSSVESILLAALSTTLLSAAAARVGAEQPLDPTDSEADQSQAPGDGAVVPSLGGYHQILLQPVDLAYTAEFSKDAWRQRHKIGSRDLERIRRYFAEIVDKELAESHPVATEPGPGVLRIDPILVDAVVDKSDWLAPARDTFKKRDKLMLLAVLRDSQTGAIVHRVLVDARSFGDVLVRQDPLNYWDDMRYLLRLLATRVRWALEARPHSSAIASNAPSAGS
jgi:hypothetical protein